VESAFSACLLSHAHDADSGLHTQTYLYVSHHFTKPFQIHRSGSCDHTKLGSAIAGSAHVILGPSNDVRLFSESYSACQRTHRSPRSIVLQSAYSYEVQELGCFMLQTNVSGFRASASKSQLHISIKCSVRVTNADPRTD
jgi:hypothetical protein